VYEFKDVVESEDDINPKDVICSEPDIVPAGVLPPLSETNPKEVICADDDIVPLGNCDSIEPLSTPSLRFTNGCQAPACAKYPLPVAWTWANIPW